jgi:hypothetical protein
MWNVWHSQLGPRGTLTSTPIYMHKLFLDRAFGWHHGFHAMAMSRDAKRAVDVLLAMFDYTNHLGVFPDNLSNQHQETWFTHGPVVAPTQALVILGLLDGGETEAARFLAARYLNALNTEGLALGIHPFRVEPVTDTPVFRMNSWQSVSFPFSAWVASIYLLLAQL